MPPDSLRFSTLRITLASALLLFTQACTGQEAVTSQTDEVPEASADAFVVPETAAGEVLAAAMAEARATDRLLFVHSGADW